MVYVLRDGRTVEGPQHGGTGGRPTSFTLDPDEFIIGVSGRYGDRIDSLQFITNKRMSEMFGGSGGTWDYRLDVPSGSQAVGFVGRSGALVDAIGLEYASLPRVTDIFSRIFPREQTPSGQYTQTQVAGGGGGTPYTDQDVAPGARIAEVIVHAGDTIDSVQALYVLPDGSYVEGARHGGPGGRPYRFRLDSDEFITGLSGRCGARIDSLQIVTNKRTSEAFGGRGGDQDFRLDVPPGSQALGFVGQAGDLVDAIGLVYAPQPRLAGIFSMAGTTSGQYTQTQVAGGGGGSPFTDQEVAAGARVAEVIVRADDTIDSIQAVYLLPDGRTVEGARHGGAGGRPSRFRLERDEYVTGLAGRFGNVVDSLSIITNKRQSPTFGGRGGDRDFRFDVPPGSQAIGFAGRSGDGLDAIGLVYASTPRRTPFRPDREAAGQRREEVPGGEGGIPYTDGEIAPGARLAEVIVRAGDMIDSIQAVYLLPDGSYVEGAQHGGSGGRRYSFRLDSDEYITSLVGRSGAVVESLTIVTNKRTSPTFGGRGGTRDFRFDVPPGSRVIGFTGRAGDKLDAVSLVYRRGGSPSR